MINIADYIIVLKVYNLAFGEFYLAVCRDETGFIYHCSQINQQLL